MNGPTPHTFAPHRIPRPWAPRSSTRPPALRFAFLDLDLTHIDPIASANAANGARYVPVARDLGRLLFDQQSELADAVRAGATLDLGDVLPAYRDDVAGFDHVACHLRAYGIDPVQLRIDTFFYRGERVVATTEQWGRLAKKVAVAPYWEERRVHDAA